MKRVFLFLAVLPLVVFVSCSKDENAPNNQEKEEIIEVPTSISYNNFPSSDFMQDYHIKYDDKNRITSWTGTLLVSPATFEVSRKINYDGETNKVLSIEMTIDDYHTTSSKTVSYTYERNKIIASDGNNIILNDKGLVAEYANFKYEYNEKDNLSVKSVWTDGQKIEEFIYTYDDTKNGIFAKVNVPQWLIVTNFFYSDDEMSFAQNITNACTKTVHNKYGESESTKVLNFENKYDYNNYPEKLKLTDSFLEFTIGYFSEQWIQK